MPLFSGNGRCTGKRPQAESVFACGQGQPEQGFHEAGSGRGRLPDGSRRPPAERGQGKKVNPSGLCGTAVPGEFDAVFSGFFRAGGQARAVLGCMPQARTASAFRDLSVLFRRVCRKASALPDDDRQAGRGLHDGVTDFQAFPVPGKKRAMPGEGSTMC
ncbi:hypothetical protein OFAG_01111 [Oxalobacter formigenes HOxBLS]|uniref:Uncharacterized protein n=1 Tax=Oxalobacter paraformigenes TaxID=556268 RepID=C3X422_9BURK|nr:hypothetical protein OFAG_01111 [Oxalobacter paraformigenes]